MELGRKLSYYLKPSEWEEIAEQESSFRKELNALNPMPPLLTDEEIYSLFPKLTIEKQNAKKATVAPNEKTSRSKDIHDKPIGWRQGSLNFKVVSPEKIRKEK